MAAAPIVLLAPRVLPAVLRTERSTPRSREDRSTRSREDRSRRNDDQQPEEPEQQEPVDDSSSSMGDLLGIGKVAQSENERAAAKFEWETRSKIRMEEIQLDREKHRAEVNQAIQERKMEAEERQRELDFRREMMEHDNKQRQQEFELTREDQEFEHEMRDKEFDLEKEDRQFNQDLTLEMVTRGYEQEDYDILRQREQDARDDSLLEDAEAEDADIAWTFLHNCGNLIKAATLNSYNIILVHNGRVDEEEEPLQGLVAPIDTVKVNMPSGRSRIYRVLVFKEGVYVRNGSQRDDQIWYWPPSAKEEGATSAEEEDLSLTSHKDDMSRLLGNRMILASKAQEQDEADLDDEDDDLRVESIQDRMKRISESREVEEDEDEDAEPLRLVFKRLEDVNPEDIRNATRRIAENAKIEADAYSQETANLGSITSKFGGTGEFNGEDEDEGYPDTEAEDYSGEQEGEEAEEEYIEDEEGYPEDEEDDQYYGDGDMAGEGVDPDDEEGGEGGGYYQDEDLDAGGVRTAVEPRDGEDAVEGRRDMYADERGEGYGNGDLEVDDDTLPSQTRGGDSTTQVPGDYEHEQGDEGETYDGRGYGDDWGQDDPDYDGYDDPQVETTPRRSTADRTLEGGGRVRTAVGDQRRPPVEDYDDETLEEEEEEEEYYGNEPDSAPADEGYMRTAVGDQRRPTRQAMRA